MYLLCRNIFFYVYVLNMNIFVWITKYVYVFFFVNIVMQYFLCYDCIFIYVIYYGITWFAFVWERYWLVEVIR